MDSLSLTSWSFLGPLGLVYLYEGAEHLRRYRRGRATESWRRTHGRIRHSAFELVRGKVTLGLACIRYVYVVDGRRYVGKDISYRGYEDTGLERATPLLHKFPKGRRVTVWYDPAHPARAVLHQGASPCSLRAAALAASTGIGILVGTAGLLAWLSP